MIYQRGNVVIFKGGEYAVLPLVVDEEMSKAAKEEMYKMEYKKPIKTMVYQAIDGKHPVYLIGHPNGYDRQHYIEGLEADINLLPERKLFLAVYKEEIELDTSKKKEAEKKPTADGDENLEDEDTYYKVSYIYNEQPFDLIIPAESIYDALLKSFPNLVEEQYRDNIIHNIKTNIFNTLSKEELIETYKTNFQWNLTDVVFVEDFESEMRKQAKIKAESASNEDEQLVNPIEEINNLQKVVPDMSDIDLVKLQKQTFRVASVYEKMPKDEMGAEYHLWQKKLEIIENEISKRKSEDTV